MAWRPFTSTLLSAGLALLPIVYLHYIWPQVLAWVPLHWSAAGPGHFVRRAQLWDMAWLPTVGFVVLTFLPQVQDGESFFWSSPRQRQVRLLVVGMLTLFMTSLLYRGAHDSKTTPPTPARRAAH